MGWLDDLPEYQNAPPPVGTGLTGPPAMAPSDTTPLVSWLGQLPEFQNAPAPINKETFGPPAPVAPYGFSDAQAHAMTGGLDEPVRGAGMATGRFLAGKGFNYPEAVAEVGRGREAYAAEHPWANLGANVTGGIVNPLFSPTMTAIKAAGPVGKAALSTGTGILGGTVQGAAENTTSINDMLRGARIGAEWGGATGAVGAGLGALFPEVPQAVRDVQKIGIQPTPGTIGGIWGVGENMLSHIPFTPVKAARTAVQEEVKAAASDPSFVRGAIGEPLKVIGETVNPNAMTGHAMVQDMKTKISDAYKAAVPTAGGAFDDTAQTAVKDALANAKLKLRPQEAAEFERFVQDNIVGKIGTSGKLSGPDFQTIDQALGEDAHNLITRGNPFELKLGKEYDNLQDTMREWLQRVSPTNATDLQNANLAFRTAKPIYNAARSTSDPEGFFTIAHLRSGARSANPSQFQVGQAPMQKFANDAEMQRTATLKLGASLPKGAGFAGDIMGGTTSGGGLLAGLYGLYQNPTWPLQHPFLSALAAGSYPLLKGAYSTPTGRRVSTEALGLLGKVPPAVAALSPHATQVVPGLATGLLNQYTQP
jgi:hypothetical protein